MRALRAGSLDLAVVAAGPPFRAVDAVDAVDAESPELSVEVISETDLRSMVAVAPDGVRVLPVRGGPRETRRVLTARMPGRRSDALRIVEDALRTTVADLA